MAGLCPHPCWPTPHIGACRDSRAGQLGLPAPFKGLPQPHKTPSRTGEPPGRSHPWKGAELCHTATHPQAPRPEIYHPPPHGAQRFKQPLVKPQLALGFFDTDHTLRISGAGLTHSKEHVPVPRGQQVGPTLLPRTEVHGGARCLASQSGLPWGWAGNQYPCRTGVCVGVHIGSLMPAFHARLPGAHWL